ncbi:unnamed protein product [Echinostoma caproni]|uniref:Ras family protein n=1 Tax=Echinostoma caproni TaxID=27848 RepID=A0A183AKV0_9TREM|nr:unnamed protein product [Echinostoma caproni]
MDNQQQRMSDGLSLLSAPSVDGAANRASCPPPVTANGKIKPSRPPRPPMIPQKPTTPQHLGSKPMRTKPSSNGTRTAGGGTGIDLAKKIFIVEGHRIQLEIWDTAGQEQYYSIVALHFREARAFVVVYDVTDIKSFEQIRKYWLKSVDQYMDEPVPVFFAANKADMSKYRQVSTEQGEQVTPTGPHYLVVCHHYS